jgi:hypothetical protein
MDAQSGADPSNISPRWEVSRDSGWSQLRRRHGRVESNDLRERPGSIVDGYDEHEGIFAAMQSALAPHLCSADQTLLLSWLPYRRAHQREPFIRAR